jgi:hypothetical protein
MHNLNISFFDLVRKRLFFIRLMLNKLQMTPGLDIITFGVRYIFIAVYGASPDYYANPFAIIVHFSKIIFIHIKKKYSKFGISLLDVFRHNNCYNIIFLICFTIYILGIFLSDICIRSSFYY